MARITPSERDLLSFARQPDDLATIALAGVIDMALRVGKTPLIRGLSPSRFEKLLNEHFAGIALPEVAQAPCDADDGDEFDDLLGLLLEFRVRADERCAWIAYAVASASMGENHLWQDMGLPSRKYLSALMVTYFPALAARNSGDMKWKKFFYRQLCERAGVPICKSPHCGECCDYAVCFGSED